MIDRCKRRAVALAAAAMISTATWSTGVLAQDEEDPLAARVEDREIHRSDVLETARELPPAYMEQIETIYPFLRDRLVDFELVAIDGRKGGLADDEEVQAMVREFEDEAIRRVYLRHLIEEHITDEVLQERYAAFVAAQPPVEEVRARHILVETREEADAIIEELDDGADFSELAKERSLDRASAEAYGGDLGYFIHDEMVTPFADAAFALQAGEYTREPIQTEYGWHVVMVDDHRIKAPPTFDEMHDELEGQVAEMVIQERLDELRADAAIEVFDYYGDPDEPDGDGDDVPAAGEDPAGDGEPAAE